LLHIASGGAGPCYGFFGMTPLERVELPHLSTVIQDEDGTEISRFGTGLREVPQVCSSIKRPFPLSASWAPADGRPLPIPPESSPYDGCLQLVELGYGAFQFIVVRGPAAGQIWGDYTAANGAISKDHDDFLDWYEAWLDEAQLEWVERYSVEIALQYPKKFGEIDDVIALLRQKLEISPQWHEGWRALGYIEINQEEYAEALHAFEQAAACQYKDFQARLQLDKGRLAGFQQNMELALEEVERGLQQPTIGVSTRKELYEEKIYALDGLQRTEEARLLLGEMMATSFSHFNHHFRYALRSLEVEQQDDAWAALEDAIQRKVGPRKHHKPSSREGVYQAFVDWLQTDETGTYAHFVQLTKSKLEEQLSAKT